RPEAQAGTNDGLVVCSAIGLANNVRLGLVLPISEWADNILLLLDSPHPNNISSPVIRAAYDKLVSDLKVTVGTTSAPPAVTDPSKFVTGLLKPPNEQARSSFHLTRSLASSADERADVHPQLLIDFAPKLKTTYYTAWEAANVNPASSPVKAVYVLRAES